MQAEADISLADYLAHAPDRERQPRRWHWHMERYRFAARQVAERFPGVATPLGWAADLGCGLGFGIEVIAPLARRMLAADINPEVVAHARRTCRFESVEFETLDVHEQSPPGGPYDLICLFEVIEHLEEPGQALERLRAALAPGGMLVLSTPHSPLGDLGTHAHHAQAFRHDTLRALLLEYFPVVTSYSQGSNGETRQIERTKDRSLLMRLVRTVDRFQLRRFLPRPLRRKATAGLTGIDPVEARERFLEITPGMDPDARWSVVVCEVPRAPAVT